MGVTFSRGMSTTRVSHRRRGCGQRELTAARAASHNAGRWTPPRRQDRPRSSVPGVPERALPKRRSARVMPEAEPSFGRVVLCRVSNPDRRLSRSLPWPWTPGPHTSRFALCDRHLCNLGLASPQVLRGRVRRRWRWGARGLRRRGSGHALPTPANGPPRPCRSGR